MTYIDKSATISSDGKYRYILRRCWDNSKPSLAYIMLNPSTADGHEDDATIRKCVGFAERLGFGSISVVNLFAFRATEPKELKRTTDPVGQDNDIVIQNVCRAADMVIAAWGAHGTYKDRNKQVNALLQGIDTYCLGSITKNGQPKHPLYIPYDKRPLMYRNKHYQYEQNEGQG